MHWKLKAAAFRLLDVMPFGSELHFAMQRHVTRAWPRPAKSLDALISRAAMFSEEYVATSGQPLDSATFLEIGSGRDLCVPLALRALGVGRVITSDISRLARIDLINHAAKHVAASLGVNVPTFSRMEDLATWGIEYAAPVDARSIAGPIDAIVSNEVLEHIDHETLRSIIAASAKQLRPGGMSIHTIDYSDHFARGGSVSRHNFLRYSDEEWRRFNSSFQYVNRLRHGDYLQTFCDGGFEIVADEPRHADLPPGMALAAQFASRPDASILGARIVARAR